VCYYLGVVGICEPHRSLYIFEIMMCIRRSQMPVLIYILILMCFCYPIQALDGTKTIVHILSLARLSFSRCPQSSERQVISQNCSICTQLMAPIYFATHFVKIL